MSDFLLLRGAAWSQLSLATLLGAGLVFSACKRQPETAENTAPAAEESSPLPDTPAIASNTKPTAKPKTAPANKPAGPLAQGPAELWKEFNGERAMEDVRKQVEVGPRHSGSSTIEAARVHIETTLKAAGWDVERQSFTDTTPRGPINFVNLIARFRPPGAAIAPTNTQRAIVCSHYDTKRFSTIRFVGANDGGSSTGALLELARVLALAPALAVQVELVFFDGEEAIVQFDDTDGLYGSRYYAKQLRDTQRAAQFKFGILWDMIGDADYGITMPPDSPQELAKDILAAAQALNVRDKFGYFDRHITDDHVSLITFARIPTVDLIDFHFPAWHTADDTLERLSPESLRITGAVTLYHLRKALSK